MKDMTALTVLANVARAVATQLGANPRKPDPPRPTGLEWVSLGNGVGWWEPY